MILNFDTRGNDKQKECARAWINDDIKEIIYGGGKGGAKSYTGVSLIFGDAFMYPGTFYFIARKKLNDLRKFTRPSIHEVFNHWGITENYYKFDGTDLFYELYNGSRVYLIEAKYLPSDPLYQRLGSMQMTRGWIEEAGEFPLDAKSNLNASIGRWKNGDYGLVGKLLQTCNPSKNYLYRDYKAFKDGKLESYKTFIQALPTDNKMLPSGYIDNLRRSLSKNEKERLLHGNWEYDDDPNTLCEYNAILDCFTNDHVKKGKNYISADLAMKGRDKFVAGHWEGNIAYVDIVKDKSRGKEIEMDLRGLMNKYNVPRSRTVFDSDGLGNYLESYLEGMYEFKGNHRPRDRKYKNEKTECAYKLAELINKAELKIVCKDEYKQLIIEELEMLKSVDASADESKLAIISKDLMKEMLGRSPDFLDWLLMKMHFNVSAGSSEGFGVAS